MAVVVVVGEVHAHPGEGLAVFVEPHAREQADLREGAVPIVVVQKALHRVIGHIDVDEAVAVVVAERHAEALAWRRRDAGLRRDVGERAVAVVAVQEVRRGIEIVRVTVGAVAWLVLAAMAVLLEAPLQIAGHEQIEAAVVVVVEEPGAGAPSVSRDPCTGRDVGERAVSLVAIEPVAAIAGDVEIREAVVVVVADRRAHPIDAVGGAAETGFLCLVHEGAVALLPVQAVPESRLRFVGSLSRRLRIVNPRPVREEQIQAAVVVDVEHGHAAAHGLEQVLVRGGGMLVLKVDRGGPGDVGELHAGSGGRIPRREQCQGAGDQSRATGAVHPARPSVHRSGSRSRSCRRDVASSSSRSCFACASCFSASSFFPIRASSNPN